MRKGLPPIVMALAVWLSAIVVTPVAAQQASLVGVDPARIEPLVQSAPVVGRFVACRSGVVAARIAGPIDAIRAEVGDRVEQGDVLAVLVRDRYAAELALRSARMSEAEAVITATQAEVNLRGQELRRIGRLRNSPAFSEGRFDDKRQEVRMTEADLAEAQALLARAAAEQRLAEIAYRETEIRAPYDGVVTRRHTESGAHVNAGDPIVTLIDDQCLEIEADVPQRRAQSLQPGTTIEYDVGAGRRSAETRAVIPEENPLTRTRTARFLPEADPGAAIAAGQSVTLWLPVGAARDVLTVHKDAVLTRRGQKVVYIVEDGKAAIRTIRIGESVGSRFEVLEGLSEGDVVVIRGNERLRPGQAVRQGAGASG